MRPKITPTSVEKVMRENDFIVSKTDTKGIINLFFEGATIPFLAKTLPLFELKKWHYWEVCEREKNKLD